MKDRVCPRCHQVNGHMSDCTVPHCERTPVVMYFVIGGFFLYGGVIYALAWFGVRALLRSINLR